MRYEKHKNARLHKRFCFITNLDGLWWVPAYRKWVTYDQVGDNSCQTNIDCRSIRAFRRHLRKHPEIKGKAILVSRFIGYNVYA